MRTLHSHPTWNSSPGHLQVPANSPAVSPFLSPIPPASALSRLPHDSRPDTSLHSISRAQKSPVIPHIPPNFRTLRFVLSPVLSQFIALKSMFRVNPFHFRFYPLSSLICSFIRSVPLLTSRKAETCKAHGGSQAGKSAEAFPKISVPKNVEKQLFHPRNSSIFHFFSHSVFSCFLPMAACLFLGLLAGCTTASRPASSAPTQLRVLSYNIHHAEGIDGKLDLPRIAAVINSVRPDLVALQEVDQNTTRTLKVHQAAELGRLTGLRHVFGKAMDYQGGAYGQAVLSRFPIGGHRVHQLPQETNREPRIVLLAEITLPNGEILSFAGTHLDHQRNDIRLRQAHAINDLFSNISEPSLVVGDFNAYPESEPMSVLLREWTDAAATNPQPTIPAENPTRRIDFILSRPEPQWRVLESRVLDEPVASDHRPVFCVLELRPASGAPRPRAPSKVIRELPE